MRPIAAGAARDAMAAAAGAVYPLALAPFHHWWVAILSTAVFCALLGNGLSPAGCARRAFFYGLGLFATGASWVYVSIHVYGMAPSWLAFFLTALFVLTLGLLFAVPFVLYGFLDRRRAVAVLLAFPALWVLGEWFRGWFLTGFPWLYLGYSTTDTWLAGWAPVTGVLGLGAMAAFTAAALVWLLRRRPRLGTVGPVLLAAAFWLAGWQLREVPWTDPAGKPLSVTLVQPAVPLEQKWNRASLDHIQSTLLRLTAGHWTSDLVVWPESAIPRLADQVPGYLSLIDRLARQGGAALLTGIPTRRNNHFYNSVLGLGKARGRYDKRHLVPFGEYVPLETWLRGAIRFFDLPMSNFSSGSAHQPLIHARGYPVATAICYEIVYPDLVARDARHAAMLLTVSNDTWFGHSIGPHQHFQMARMRALENGKPLLRATNDGITAIVDSSGRVSARLPQFEQGVLTGTFVPRRGSTPFSRYGSLPVVCAAFLSALIGLLFARRRPGSASG